MLNIKRVKLVLLGAIIFNFSFAYSQYYDSGYSYYGADNYYNQYPNNSNNSYDSRYSNYPYGRYQENQQSARYRSDRSRSGSALTDMNDWDYHESWRDDRQSFFRGDTQPEAIRKAHPYGEAGIGYDADPLYLKMKENYTQLRIEKAEAERRSAEAERRTAEAERRVAEAERRALNTSKTQTSQKTIDQTDVYTVRTGGGRSQKGKRSAQQRGGGSSQRYPNNYQNNQNYQNDNPYGRDPYYNGDYWYY